MYFVQVHYYFQLAQQHQAALQQTAQQSGSGTQATTAAVPTIQIVQPATGQVQTVSVANPAVEQVMLQNTNQHKHKISIDPSVLAWVTPVTQHVSNFCCTFMKVSR